MHTFIIILERSLSEVILYLVALMKVHLLEKKMTTDFSGAQLINFEILCENKESIFLSTDYQKAKLNLIGRRHARRDRRANRAI